MPRRWSAGPGAGIYHPGVGWLTVNLVGESIVQSAQPRDLAALLFVIALFLVLFVISVALGGPIR